MLPMTIRCKRCGSYSNQGTKFNMRQEVIGEKYRNTIPIFRLYFKCKMCSTEITIKTDPQNADYTVESGAARYSGEGVCEEKRRKRDADERGDSMKSLEKRTLDSKREMDILSNLDEIKSMNSRHARVSHDAMLEALQRQQKELRDEDDEALIKLRLHGSKENIRRIDDDNLDDTYDTVFSDLNGSRTSQTQTGSKKRKVSKSQTDFLSETSTHDKLNYTKEDQSGQLTLKSSVIKFTAVKKSFKPKTQASEEEKKKTSITSNVSKSLRQRYDEDHSAWNTCSEWSMLADLVPSSVVYRKTIHRRKNITYLGSNLLLKLSVKEDDGNMVDATVRLYGPNTEYVTNREWELQLYIGETFSTILLLMLLDFVFTISVYRPYSTFDILHRSAVGFGAKFMGVFENGMVQSFIHARTLEPLDFKKPKLAAEIAKQLFRFHQVEIPGSREPQLWNDIFKFYGRESTLTFHDHEKQKKYATISFEEVHTELMKLKELTGPRDAPVVFAHNDLLSGNLMLNDEEILVVSVDPNLRLIP
ncbi:probable ethanolamine kinase [Tanacetum coccineum]